MRYDVTAILRLAVPRNQIEFQRLKGTYFASTHTVHTLLRTIIGLAKLSLPHLPPPQSRKVGTTTGAKVNCWSS